MKGKKKENLNLFFSAFLVLGYIVCTYFFMTLAATLQPLPQTLILIAVFLVFGLLLFYATRVGDGVPVKRFSPIILCVLDIPCLYAILAYAVPNLPLHDQISEAVPIFYFAAIALGYGIPYTFFSGFEMKEDVYETEEEIEEKIVSGGIREELLEIDDNDMDDPRLIEREKGEFPSEEKADEETVDELKVVDGVEDEKEHDGDNDYPELEKIEDRDMDEPELIGSEKEE